MPKGAAAMRMGGLSAAIGAGLLACGSVRGWNLPGPHGSSGSGRIRSDPFQPCSPPTVAGAAPALHPVRKALRRPSRMRTGFPFHPGDDLPGTSMKLIVPKIWGSSTPRTQYVAPSNTLGHHGRCCANAKRHDRELGTPCRNMRQVPVGKGFSENIHVAWMLHDRPSERGRRSVKPWAQYHPGHIGRTCPGRKGCLTISVSSSSGMREGAGWRTP